MFEPEVFRKQRTVLKKVVETLLGLFSTPRSDSAPEELCPSFPPRYPPDRTGKCIPLLYWQFCSQLNTSNLLHKTDCMHRNFYDAKSITTFWVIDVFVSLLAVQKLRRIAYAKEILKKSSQI